MYYPSSARLESGMEFFMENQGNPRSLFSCGDSCDAGAVIWDKKGGESGEGSEE